jgi:hypothetical protein
MARTRPTGVTVVAIIVLISGVIGTVGSLLQLLSGGPSFHSIAGLIIGILTLGVSAGLFMGSQIARILTTIVLVLQLASSIFSIGAIGFANFEVAWPLVSGVLALAGIILLYTKQANAYFR